MKQTSHMGALIGLTSISALLAVLLGIVGYVADDLETAIALNYWANLFTTATVVGIFSMIVLSGVLAQFKPDDAEKLPDMLPQLPPEPEAQPVEEPQQEQPKGPYRPGQF